MTTILPKMTCVAKGKRETCLISFTFPTVANENFHSTRSHIPVSVRHLVTRFDARNFMNEPGHQEPYGTFKDLPTLFLF
jgi:hypothetical protein